MSLPNDRTTEPSFADPALREACCLAWADERAPAPLRDRVAQTLAAESQHAAAVERRWRLGSVRGLAAAAVLLLAFGAVAGHFAGLLGTGGGSRDASSTPIAATPVSLIPAPLAAQLARVHRNCSSAANHHHIACPSSDFQQITSHLRKRLGQPVVMCTPGQLDDTGNWTFCGAAVCPVGGHRAGHLVFSRGQSSVSVFSLPARACPEFPAGERCERPAEACNIAAFRQGDGFFCVVGSSTDGSLTCEQVRALRDRLRDNVVAARLQDGAVARRCDR